MTGSFWTRLKPAVWAVVTVISLLLNSSTTALAQETPAADTPAVEAATPAVDEAVAPTALTPAPTPEEMITKLGVGIDTIWVMVCGMLVFFMNLGFGCVESGFCRAKNCVNILSKNFVVFAVCSIGFWCR